MTVEDAFEPELDETLFDLEETDLEDFDELEDELEDEYEDEDEDEDEDERQCDGLCECNGGEGQQKRQHKQIGLPPY